MNRVVVVYNDEIRIIEERKNPKFRYIGKIIEVYDDHSCKYIHEYDNHTSTKIHHLAKKWQFYRNLFNVGDQLSD